ncbi:S-methyl-5'-thioadenosine phosphorylase [soil metagenome]
MSDLKIGLIGGSGLGAAFAGKMHGIPREIDTPFGKTSDAIIETELHGVLVFFLNRHGPGHLLNPSLVPYRANIFALKQLGVTHIIASGAVGSLREEYQPQQLVIPDQIIDKTQKRTGTFFETAAVHVEFAEPFCPVLRRILIESSEVRAQSSVGEPASAGVSCAQIHPRACYVAMEGPAFSTRAESLMYRLWGGDLIGMTAMPEAKLAREAEIAYALVALVTDYDSWRAKTADVKQTETDPSKLLREIIANLNAASANAIALIESTIALMAQRREELAESPALGALQLAIWSDKSKIAPEEVRRLAPLWLKYFS